jgi:AcrR family transcriptional regulator
MASPGSPTKRRRKTAEQRREEIVTVALRQFAQSGYRATSTETIAHEAGISQPYLFRLFGTKRDLFLACWARTGERIRRTFEDAARGLPKEERLEAMGDAYIRLLAEREELLFQMQAYAACSDPEIREPVRRGYGELLRDVVRISGAGPEETWHFFAEGMLLNVIASLDLPAVAEARDWAAYWAMPEELFE